MADPIESTADNDVRRELKEAADAAAKAARTRNAADIADAVKEGGEAAVALARSGWSWQQIAFAVVAAVATLFVGVGSVAMVTRDANPPTVVNVPVKADPDIAKLLTDGFARLDKTMMGVGLEIKSLGKKLDDKPAPLPVDPDKPKPPAPAKKLTLPERVEVAVGSVVKVKATGSANVQWTWRESPGLDVDKHGSTLYVSAEKDGTYWVFAYTSADGKIGDIAACMIVAGKGPQPPPGPTPEPKPPAPTDWPTTAPGLRVLIVFEEMERHKLAPSQRAIIDGAPIRDWLDTKCVQDGTVKAWRIFDQNQGVQGAEKHWQEMMGRKRNSVPWVVICNHPKAWYEGVLPNSVDELKAQVQKVE